MSRTVVRAGGRCSFGAFKEEEENKWEVEVIGSSIDHRSFCVVRREDDRPIRIFPGFHLK